MQKHIYIFITVLFALFQSNAQNQANVWYFGHYKGLDFNKDTVKVLEGPASFQRPINSICNKVGDLRFYLNDRSEFYNAEHNLIKEFKLTSGHQIVESSIIPHPKQEDIYYIFTIQTSNIINYGQALKKEDDYFKGVSLVPSSIAGVGQGLQNRKFYLYYYLLMVDSDDRVIFLQQQEKLMELETRKISSIVLKQKEEYSFLLLDGNKAELTMYGIDSGGFDSETKKVLKLGQYKGLENYRSMDYINLVGGSMQGNKLAIFSSKKLGNSTDRRYHILEWNSKVRNLKYLLNIPVFFRLAMSSAEFSGDGSKFYISVSNGSKNTVNQSDRIHLIYQYDLSSNDSEDILNSKVEMTSKMQAGETAVYDLQLAPNGKIYGVSLYEYMYVINHPNERGRACGFEPRAVYLGKGANGGLYLPRVTHLLGK